MPYSMCGIQYVQELQQTLVSNFLFDWNGHWTHIYRTPLLLYKNETLPSNCESSFEYFLQGVSCNNHNECRVDYRNHLSNTWMPIRDNTQLIHIIYKASHILKKIFYETSLSLSMTEKTTESIWFSVSCATVDSITPPYLLLRNVPSTTFSFLKNQLSKHHMIQRSTGTSYFHRATMSSCFWDSQLQTYTSTH